MIAGRGGWTQRPASASPRLCVKVPHSVAELARTWRVPRDRIGVCGLKDRHGLTTQSITLLGPPPPPLQRSQFRVDCLGKTDQPAAPAVLLGNRFRITVRDLGETEAEAFRLGLEALGRDGLPNYFDEQRFGSAVDGRFAARLLLAGDAEGALRLALATLGPEDPPRLREIRGLLARAWGSWDRCLRELPPCPERIVVSHLAKHPRDFAGAFEQIDRRLRFLYVSAYQSYLWNEVVSRLLRKAFPGEHLLLRKLEHWRWPFPTEVGEEARLLWRRRSIPLPARKMAECEPVVEEAIREVLAAEGLDPRALRLRGLRETYFDRGSRAAWLAPEELRTSPPASDELNPRRVAVSFECRLPKGSYATLLTRRLLGTWKRGKSLDL
ncbi:MAG: tRNA pseudouridine(13) synthase TruD [Planctomycetes bacterium]|nr:tRNA pseudouridine(13) synthase TruD [Planctomycetota bacterium]